MNNPLKLKEVCVALLLLISGATPQAIAVQIVEAADGTTIYAKVSKREQTRLALEQGRITTLRVKSNELEVEPDQETGQLFLSVPAGVTQSISAFLTTDGGSTFTVVFQVVDGPADSIIIKQPSRRTERSQANLKSTTYDKAVKRLITVMATDEVPDDMQVREAGYKVPLWKEVSMSIERVYVASAMVGERYMIANVSQAAVILDEREFYRKGVSVVAVENLNLAPSESTRIYVIREKKPND